MKNETLENEIEKLKLVALFLLFFPGGYYMNLPYDSNFNTKLWQVYYYY